LRRKSEFHVTLIVQSDSVSPDEVTSILQLEPTKVWKPGDPVAAESNRVVKTNIWRLTSTADPMQYISEPLIDALLAVIQPKRARFSLLPKDRFIELQCAVYFMDNLPGIALRPDHVAFLAELGASFDVDLYRLPVRETARVIGHLGEPIVKHYRGLPPELAGGQDGREQMEAPAVVAIEEKPDGVFLFRFTADGKVVGDTWHKTVEEAEQQARFEFPDLLSEWKPVPLLVEDLIAFGLQD